MTLEKTLLFNNLIILSFSILYGSVPKHRLSNFFRSRHIFPSLLFSLLMLLVMLNHYSPTRGMQLDLRGSVLVLSGVFCSGVTLLSTLLTGIAYRLVSGGAAAGPGIAIMIGITVYTYLYKRFIVSKNQISMQKFIILVFILYATLAIAGSIDPTHSVFYPHYKDNFYLIFSIGTGNTILAGLLLNMDFRVSYLKSSLSVTDNIFNEMAEHFSESLLVLSSDLESIRYVNKEFKNLWHTTQKHLSKSPLSWIYSLDDHQQKAANNIIRRVLDKNSKAKSFDFPEFNIIDRGGNTTWIHTKCYPVYDSSGDIEYIIFISYDVTEKINNEFFEEEKLWNQSMGVSILEKEIEARTKELKVAKNKAEEANKLKSDFLANISHELRTPMHSIMSFTSFGISKIDRVNKDKLLTYFKNIHDSASRLLHLINNLLDLAKLESGKIIYDLQENDINHVFTAVKSETSELLKQKDQKLEIISNGVSTYCVFDHTKIMQVMLNLISNAIKFSPPATPITIECSDGTLASDETSEPALHIKVIDKGVGIPADELNRIFNKFIQSSKTQTNAGGTGLGLAICHEIIKGHNGRIWAENNSDSSGTIFQFLLPQKHSC